MSKIPGAINRALAHTRWITDHPDGYPNAVRGRVGLAAESLADAAKLAPAALNAMLEMLPGPAAASYDGPGGGHGTVLDENGVPMPTIADPTGEQAIRANHDLEAARTAFALHAHRCEHLALALRFRTRPDLTETANQLQWSARQLWICASEAPRALTDAQRAALPGPPGCESCARVTDSIGRPTHAPVEPRGADDPRPVRRNVGGHLYHLCRWCAAYGRENGELPTRDLVARHHDPALKRTAQRP